MSDSRDKTADGLENICLDEAPNGGDINNQTDHLDDHEIDEVVNQVEGMIHDTESKIEEFKSQLPEEEVTSIKNKISDVRNLISTKDQESPKTLLKETQELQQASLKLFDAGYKKDLDITDEAEVQDMQEVNTNEVANGADGPYNKMETLIKSLKEYKDYSMVSSCGEVGRCNLYRLGLENTTENYSTLKADYSNLLNAHKVLISERDDLKNKYDKSVKDGQEKDLKIEKLQLQLEQAKESHACDMQKLMRMINEAQEIVKETMSFRKDHSSSMAQLFRKDLANGILKKVDRNVSNN